MKYPLCGPHPVALSDYSKFQGKLGWLVTVEAVSMAGRRLERATDQPPASQVATLVTRELSCTPAGSRIAEGLKCCLVRAIKRTYHNECSE